MSKTPDLLADYVRAAVDFVKRSLGIVLDGSDTSLAILDHYLSQVPGDRRELLSLVAPAAGAYFGEVVRRRFGGEWLLHDEPNAWRLALADGLLVLSPVGMAATAIAQAEVEGYDAGIEISQDYRKEIEAALGRSAPVTCDYYYSLTGRFETIQHVLDLLAGLKARSSTRN